MKIRVAISITSLILLFAFIGSGIGCSEDSNLGELMSGIPYNVAEYQYYDVDVLRGDKDLGDIYNDLRDMYEDELDICGISFGDVNCIADCESVGWGELILFKGEFDLDDISSALEGGGYIETDYSEKEVWMDDGGTMVALFESLVVIGDEEEARETIDVIKGKEDSLSDNSDAKGLINKVSAGITTIYKSHREGEGVSFGGSYSIDNYKAFSASIKKKSGDTVSMTMVVEFDDADEAGDTLGEVEGMFEEDDEEAPDYKNVDVKQDGEFVVIYCEADIDDFY